MSDTALDIVEELHNWAHIVDGVQGKALVWMLNGSVFVDAAGEIINLRAEIVRLQAAGDEMADAAIHQQWSRLDVAVAAWKEARRG